MARGKVHGRRCKTVHATKAIGMASRLPTGCSFAHLLLIIHLCGAAVVHDRQRDHYFILVQSECGDLYKTLAVEGELAGRALQWAEVLNGF